jgi:peptide-methionine (R)-S-oxide reductase
MSRRHIARTDSVVIGMIFALTSTNARAQDPLENAPLAPQSAARATADAAESTSTAPSTAAKVKATTKPEFINKPAAEWRKLLTKVQYAVTREKSTEPPYTGRYASGHYQGIFVCICCDVAHVQSELFNAQAKFESGTGWPSFYQTANNKAVHTAWDYSGFEPRLEVNCRRCGAHLGHVFDDGPPPTGMRFCINSAAIKLVTPAGMAGARRGAAKGSAKPQSTRKRSTDSKPATTTETPSDQPADPAKSAPGL